MRMNLLPPHLSRNPTQNAQQIQSLDTFADSDTSRVESKTTSDPVTAIPSGATQALHFPTPRRLFPSFGSALHSSSLMATMTYGEGYTPSTNSAFEAEFLSMYPSTLHLVLHLRGCMQILVMTNLKKTSQITKRTTADPLRHFLLQEGHLSSRVFCLFPIWITWRLGEQC